MKRFNCTLSDKRGEFGECMEAHSTGRYVLFSDVEKLQRRMQELLDKSNRTGVAIERAISTGAVLADHPLKSRLDLLANHHKREQVLAELLRRARRYVSPLSCPESEIQIVQSIVSSIDSVLAGKLPGAWLPIETAPHDGRKALVYRPLAENSGDERIAVKRLTGGRSNSCWDKTVPPGETPCNPTDGACHVTHWMPLPDEPAQQGGEPCAIASPSSSPD
ncbi:DUF551 domain-containing protein [Aeromonas dhakensis]|uniref:hypothetical protein n=1 Tax=Aeromonas dhakensis TaxID=196024 RepID=UPI002B4950B7|nr:hypothetical protein [Aeromonas dhakensis]